MPVPSSSSTAAGPSSPTRNANHQAGRDPLVNKAAALSSRTSTITSGTIPKHKVVPTDLRGISGFSSKQRAYLTKAGFITTQELLYTPSQILSEKFKINLQDAEDYARIVTRERAQKWLQQGSVASQLQASRNAGSTSASSNGSLLKTGDEGIDEVLGGGLRSGTLTEFAGEASSGKTALALQMALRVQFPVEEGGLAGSCAYLCSEGNFPSTRLVDIASSQCRGQSIMAVRDLTDNVHLIHCAEVEDLLHATRYSLPALVERLAAPDRQDDAAMEGADSQVKKPVRLVIVDSIAAPFRGSEASGSVQTNGKGKGRAEDGDGPVSYSFAQRNAHLYEIATSLHGLAARHQLCVVLVNQVSDVFNSSNNNASDRHSEEEQISHEGGGIPIEYRNYSLVSRYFSGEDAGKGGKMAVFGLPWANLLQTRLMLSRTGRRRRRVPAAALEDEVIDGFDLPPVDEQAEDDLLINGGAQSERMGEVQTVEVRRANLVFSPFAERGYIDYVLRGRGLVSIGQAIQQPRAVPGAKAGKASQSSMLNEEEEEAALWEGAGTDSDMEQLVIPATAGMEVEV